MRPLAVATSLREKLAQRQHLSSPVESRLFHAAMRQTQDAASQSRWALDARSRLKINQTASRCVENRLRADSVTLSYRSFCLSLAFWNVFAQHAFVALDPPLPVGAILKPLCDTYLGMNLAIHHGDAGLITVGDDLFQADLAVAQ